MSDEAPQICVFRDHLFTVLPHGRVRWAEASPGSAHRHSIDCGCTLNVEVRPSGKPLEVRQSIWVVWNDCVIQIGNEVACPWVTFRKAGDAQAWIARRGAGDVDPDDEKAADHAYFMFDEQEQSVSVEVTSPGFGLIGCVLTNVHLGNQIDTSRFFNGHSPSRVVDLAQIAADQVWIHAHPHVDAFRLLADVEETTALRAALQQASQVRQLAQPFATATAISADTVRQSAEANLDFMRAAVELRRLLRPFAFAIEGTDLFRRAAEIEEEAQARWKREVDAAADVAVEDNRRGEP